MALSGVHIVACFAGGDGFSDSVQSIPADAVWSEQPASGVATANVAPASNSPNGRPMFRFHAAVDVYVAVGAAPNAAASPRFFLRAGVDFDLFVNQGDKAAWIAA